MVVNQDHYTNEVFHGGGTYTLDMETFDSPYVIVFMRALVEADDPDDVADVNSLQDRMTVEASSSKLLVLQNYDVESYEGLVRAALGFGPYLPDASDMFGTKDAVDPVRHFIGTAGGVSSAILRVWSRWKSCSVKRRKTR